MYVILKKHRPPPKQVNTVYLLFKLFFCDMLEFLDADGNQNIREMESSVPCPNIIVS